MKNKKADQLITPTIIWFAIAGIFAFVVIYALINGIFVKKQISGIGSTSEEITKDCDGDEVIGLNDKCPCDSSIWSKDQYTKNDKKCGTSSGTANEQCPSRCLKAGSGEAVA